MVLHTQHISSQALLQDGSHWLLPIGMAMPKAPGSVYHGAGGGQQRGEAAATKKRKHLDSGSSAARDFFLSIAGKQRGCPFCPFRSTSLPPMTAQVGCGDGAGCWHPHMSPIAQHALPWNSNPQRAFHRALNA